MKQEKIQRINELAKKKKTEGLTPEETAEQQQLYKEYLGNIRRNFTQELESLSIQNPDGNVIQIKDRKKTK